MSYEQPTEYERGRKHALAQVREIVEKFRFTKTNYYYGDKNGARYFDDVKKELIAELAELESGKDQGGGE